MIAHSKPYITELEKKFVSSSLESPVITDGSFAKQFSDGIKNYLESNDFFFTKSGTESLYVILKALNVKSGDEVILPSYVCDSVYYAIRNTGAVSVLVDVNDNWVATPEEIKSKITERTKAIIVVYTFGLPCEIESIVNFGIPVIEDLCQAIGLEIKGKKAGSFGIASFVSFKAIKCITTGGEGGGILTSNEDLINKINTLKKQYVFNDKITEVQAAFGYAQLTQYSSYLQRRKRIADKYHELFSHSDKVIKTSHGSGMNYRFVIQTNLDVEVTIKKFAEKGVSLRKGVDALLHKTFCLKGNFAITEKIFNTTLSFPIYPALSDEEFEIIGSTIKQLL